MGNGDRDGEWRPSPKHDLSRQWFGRLKALRCIGLTKWGRNGDRVALYECKCACGNLCEVPGPSLKQGNTRSCGCLREERVYRRKTKGKETK